MSVDLTAAYPGQVARYVRTFRLVRDVVEVEDAVTLKRDTRVRWAVTTDRAVTPDRETRLAGGVSATMQSGEKLLRVELTGDAPLVVVSARQDPPQASNEGYHRLERETALPAGEHVITASFVPIK